MLSSSFVALKKVLNMNFLREVTKRRNTEREKMKRNTTGIRTRYVLPLDAKSRAVFVLSSLKLSKQKTICRNTMKPEVLMLLG